MPAHMARGNRTKSRIRAKVEHVFAEQKEWMGLFIRTIGLARAKVKIGMGTGLEPASLRVAGSTSAVTFRDEVCLKMADPVSKQ